MNILLRKISIFNMECNNKKLFSIILLLVFVTSAYGGRGRGGGGGRSHSRGGGGGFFGKSKSTSHSTSNTGSYPKQTYSTSYNSGTSHNYGTGTSHNYGTGTSHTNYGWNTGGSKYGPGQGHYYNSPGHGHHYHSPSSSNWGSSYSNPNYHQTSNGFGTFHPVSSGIAPSYHFHRSTSYVPLYIPSSHSYIHHHHTHSDRTSTVTHNTPPPPPSEPVVYKDNSTFGESSEPTMIVGFNNMIVYGVYESEKHYVITVSEDLDEDVDDIPDRFLQTKDTSLFEIVTMKPTSTTTETAQTTEINEISTVTSADSDEWSTSSTINWRKLSETLSVKHSMETNDDGGETHTGAVSDGDVLNLNFGDMIP